MQLYIENRTKEYFDFRGYKKLIETVVSACAELKNIPQEMEVNVMIVLPEEIRQINRESRGMDRVTDVLSFPYFDFISPGQTDFLFEEVKRAETILGDIVLCADRVIRQADEYGHSQKRELAFLIVHSMLHLIGYDHMEPEEETLMNREADKIMDYLSLPR